MLCVYPLSGSRRVTGILAPNSHAVRQRSAGVLASRNNSIQAFCWAFVAMVSCWIVSGSIVAPAVGHDLAPKPFRQMSRALSPYAFI
jgi:hypothetical protein